jgi:hypothetical protein
MTAYRATFTDGTSITKETPKTCTHAWRMVLKDGTSKFGFSGSQTAAYKSMNRAFAKVKYSKGWDVVSVSEETR